jgi:hypothetical protein
MALHAHGYHKVQHVMGFMASQLTQFSNRLIAEVIEPLLQFHKDSMRHQRFIKRGRPFSRLTRSDSTRVYVLFLNEAM